MSTIKSMYDLVDRMGNIRRFSHTTNIKDHRLSDHTLRVAMLSHMIAPSNVDGERLLLSALCHDLEEAICGDIVYNVKRSFPDYDKVMYKLLSEQISHEPFMDARIENSTEYKVAKLADLIDTPLQAIKEVEMGNVSNFKYMNKFMVAMESKDAEKKIFNLLNPEGKSLFISTYGKIKSLMMKHGVGDSDIQEMNL